MPYMGVFNVGGGCCGFPGPPLAPWRGNGKPLPLLKELCGVGVEFAEELRSSVGGATEKVRVMKMVRRRVSCLGSLEAEATLGSSCGNPKVEGVNDFAS